MNETKWLCVAWLGSITLAQWQAAVGVASGLAVLVYTLLRIWVLLRSRKDSE